MTKKEHRSRIFVLIAGLIIYQLGASIILLSNLGADPFNVLVQGFLGTMNHANISFLSHGCVHIIISLVLTFLLFLLNKNLVTPGTVICAFLGGPLIDLFCKILTPVYELYTNSSYFYLMFAAGFMMLAYGFTMMLCSKGGMSPNELLIEAFTNHKKRNSFVVTLIIYLVYAFIGFISGGSIGFSTLLCLAILVPLVEYFQPNISNKIEAYIKKHAV